MRLALTILIELPAGNHSVVVASAFLTLDRNRRKQRKSAGSLRFFGIYRYSQVQPNRAELNDNVLFVIDRHQSADALTQGQFEHARLFDFDKR